MSNLVQIRPVGAESMRTDRQDEPSSFFSQFCEKKDWKTLQFARKLL